MRRPSLFAELLGRYSNMPAVADELRNYLSLSGYSETAIPQVIAAFEATVDFVRGNGSNPQTASSGPRSNAGQAPFRVSVLGKRIEVSGDLADREAVDRLIDVLMAVKSLLPVDPE